MVKENETIHFSWEAPEYEHHEKTHWWSIVFGLVILGVTVYEVSQRDWFGVVAMLIVLAVAGWTAHRRPETITYELTDSGLSIADHHFPYHNLRLFWLVDNQHHRTLNFKTNHVWHATLIIPLPEGVEEDHVKAFLREILPEELHNQPTVTQKISRHLKL